MCIHVGNKGISKLKISRSETKTTVGPLLSRTLKTGHFSEMVCLIEVKYKTVVKKWQST